MMRSVGIRARLALMGDLDGSSNGSNYHATLLPGSRAAKSQRSRDVPYPPDNESRICEVVLAESAAHGLGADVEHHGLQTIARCPPAGRGVGN